MGARRSEEAGARFVDDTAGLSADHIAYGSAGIKPSPHARRFRRLVTGIDDDGRSCFAEDADSPHQVVGDNNPNFVATDLWRTSETPVVNSRTPDDGLARSVPIAPPPEGSVFRMLEIPPDHEWADVAAYRGRMHHRTASLDYAIVLSGEIWAVLDAEERVMHAGDVLIQRGTAHSWSNRTDSPALLAFVLIGGTTM